MSFPRFVSTLTVLATMLAGCQSANVPKAGSAAATAASAASPLANPVLPGDFPDPSITKVGNTYWASATSSNWGPAFPLLKSTNLQDWQLVGHVFPNQLPDWADYYFWAPEISQEGSKTYIYYTAHKKNGPLSIGIASADRPEGPYRDHGPLVSQELGSIDGFPMRDEQGKLYLVWKEDGNSQNKPTPIWAQRLNEEHTALTGEKKELFRNDAPWEGNLVEGVSMVRHGDYFYAFYAANGCCGNGCTYATGVARAKSLLGPWEKYAKNPILGNNDTWKCAGHGTAVERNGHWYLLHHAYHTAGREFVGRQGVVSEFTWNAEGWPEFKGGSTPSAPAVAVNATTQNITDDFKGTTLQPTWQWPIEEKPSFTLRDGQLLLAARPDHSGAVLGHHTYATDYTVTTTLLNPAALPAGTTAGLAALGDPDNTIALTAGGGKVQLWQMEKGQQKALGEAALPAAAKALVLRMRAKGGAQFSFDWSADGGKTWQQLPGSTAVNGSYLPPWDRGIRTGLLVRGPATTAASFEDFKLVSQ